MARELAIVLKNAGLNVYVTRGGDWTMDLLERTKALNKEKVGLAISVHCDATATSKDANYITTFVQGRGGQAEKLGQKVQTKLVQATGWPDGGVRVANYHMTRETRMPAILTECGFISNPAQERQLRQPETQKKLAKAIADGVLAYLGTKEGEAMTDIKVIVKGKEIQGKLIDSRTWVPVRELIEALKTEIIWDEKDRTVIIK